MCGIVGVVSTAPVNQLLYDALLLLQHRGQDAAGIATQDGRKFFMHKAKGMVKDVFRTRNMRALPGSVGLGQCRYPTAGNASSEEEAQPFYVNAPFGIVMVHNGNLTNAKQLREELASTDHRHTNTESDSEVLVNVLAHELEKTTRGLPLTPADVFAAQAAELRAQRSALITALRAMPGIEKCWDSQANMVLVRVADAARTYAGMQARKVLIKNVSTMHSTLANCLRLTVGSADDNARMLAALKDSL